LNVYKSKNRNAQGGVTGKNISENLGTSFYRYGEALLLKLERLASNW